MTAMSKPAICWPSASKKIDVGLADRDADDVGAARRADDRVGDLGIGDQHVLDVARQVDHDRFADAERHEARARVAADHLDRRGRGIAPRGSAAGARPVAARRARGDQRREQRGADQRRVRHVASSSSQLISASSSW